MNTYYSMLFVILPINFHLIFFSQVDVVDVAFKLKKTILPGSWNCILHVPAINI